MCKMYYIRLGLWLFLRYHIHVWYCLTLECKNNKNMVVTTDYSLVPGGHQVPQAWFDASLQNYRGKNEFLKSILTEEIAALQAFYLYQTSPDEAAQTIQLFRPRSGNLLG